MLNKDMDARTEELRSNLDMVRAQLSDAARAAGRDPAEIGLVAVSKRHSAEDMRRMVGLSQVVLGESYVQEALEKQDILADLPIQWHFIGGLQSNKAKFVAGRFHLVHSVDNSKLAQVLHKKALDAGVAQKVLIQVNLGGEAQKSGTDETGLPALAEEMAGLQGLQLMGLMTLPPWSQDPETVRPLFARLRELRDGLETRLGRKLPELSMGMSDDFPAAVAEGATLVRIGTRLFGQRP